MLIILLAIVLIVSIRKIQYEKLQSEILEKLGFSNWNVVPYFDESVTVKSRQSLEKYDDIKFFKENPKMLASAEETIQKKDAVLGTLEAFLDDNEYKSRPQYKKSKNKLMRCAAMQVHFESRSLIYRRPETIWVQSKSV